MKTNPFQKYLTKEDKFQHRVIAFLQYQYPGLLYAHVPNEGKRTVFERYKFKYLGGKAGIPDLLIFKTNKNYSGLAIELKIGYNKPTMHQKEWLKNLSKNGWYAAYFNDFDKCIDTIKKYLNDEL